MSGPRVPKDESAERITAINKMLGDIKKIIDQLNHADAKKKLLELFQRFITIIPNETRKLDDSDINALKELKSQCDQYFDIFSDVTLASDREDHTRVLEISTIIDDLTPLTKKHIASETSNKTDEIIAATTDNKPTETLESTVASPPTIEPITPEELQQRVKAAIDKAKSLREKIKDIQFTPMQKQIESLLNRYVKFESNKPDGAILDEIQLFNREFGNIKNELIEYCEQNPDSGDQENLNRFIRSLEELVSDIDSIQKTPLITHEKEAPKGKEKEDADEPAPIIIRKLQESEYQDLLDEIKQRQQAGEPCLQAIQTLLADENRDITLGKKYRKSFHEIYSKSIELMSRAMIASDKEMMLGINANEFYGGKFEARQFEAGLIPTLFPAIQRYNKMAEWVKLNIAQYNANHAVFAIDYWVNVAYECAYNPLLKDLFGAGAIVSALADADLSNNILTPLTPLLPEQTREKLNALKQLFSTNKNSKELRQYTTNNPNSIITPNIILTDITMTWESNSFRFGQPRITEFKDHQSVIEKVPVEGKRDAVPFNQPMPNINIQNDRDFKESAKSKNTKRIKNVVETVAKERPSLPIQHYTMSGEPPLEAPAPTKANIKYTIYINDKFSLDDKTAAALNNRGYLTTNNIDSLPKDTPCLDIYELASQLCSKKIPNPSLCLLNADPVIRAIAMAHFLINQPPENQADDLSKNADKWLKIFISELSPTEKVQFHLFLQDNPKYAARVYDPIEGERLAQEADLIYGPAKANIALLKNAQVINKLRNIQDRLESMHELKGNPSIPKDEEKQKTTELKDLLAEVILKFDEEQEALASGAIPMKEFAREEPIDPNFEILSQIENIAKMIASDDLREKLGFIISELSTNYSSHDQSAFNQAFITEKFNELETIIIQFQKFLEENPVDISQTEIINARFDDYAHLYNIQEHIAKLTPAVTHIDTFTKAPAPKERKLPPISEIGKYAITPPKVPRKNKIPDLLENAGSNDDALSVAVRDILGETGMAALHKGTADPSSTKHREAFYRALEKVLARTDDDLTEMGKNPEQDAIKIQALLGTEGLALYKKAIIEERNSKEFRNAVFLKAAKKFPGAKWDEQLILWVGGPSASGKSFGADSIIQKIIAEDIMGPSDPNNKDGNVVVSIDGGIEREVSQIRKLVLQVAIKKGYPGIYDLHDETPLDLKKIIKKATLASQNKLNIVIPSTFTRPLSKFGVMKYEKRENTKVIFSEVTGENADDFQHTVQRLGNRRAWMEHYGFTHAQDFEIAMNNYDVGCESKRYPPDYFEKGRKKSAFARQHYLERSKDGVYIQLKNDLIFIKPIAGTNNWERCKPEDTGENFLISARDFAKWQEEYAKNKDLPSPKKWLENNTPSTPEIDIKNRDASPSKEEINSLLFADYFILVNELKRKIQKYHQKAMDGQLTTEDIHSIRNYQKLYNRISHEYKSLAIDTAMARDLDDEFKSLETQLNDLAIYIVKPDKSDLSSTLTSRVESPQNSDTDNDFNLFISDHESPPEQKTEPAQTQQPTVLNLTMLGTYEHRDTRNTVLTRYHKAIETGPNQFKYLIDGVGGGNINDPDHPTLGSYLFSCDGIDENNEFVCEKIPKKANLRLKFLSLLGLIKATGYNDAIREASMVVNQAFSEAKRTNSLPLIINLAGYSRGADTIRRLCNELNAHYGKDVVQVNIFAIDPVPGPMRQQAIRARHLPPIVHSSEIVLMRDENRMLFAAQDKQHTVVQGKDTKVTFHQYRGIHSSGNDLPTNAQQFVRGNANNDLRTQATTLVTDDLINFANKNGTKLNPAFNKSLSTDERLDYYADMILSRQKASQLGTPKRPFTNYMTDYFLHGTNYFIDKKHMELFHEAYPELFNYFFQKNANQKINWSSLETEIEMLKQHDNQYKTFCQYLKVNELLSPRVNQAEPQGIFLRYEDFYDDDNDLMKIWENIQSAVHPVLSGFDKSTTVRSANALYQNVHKALTENGDLASKKIAIAKLIKDYLTDAKNINTMYHHKLIGILNRLGTPHNFKCMPLQPILESMRASLQNDKEKFTTDPKVTQIFNAAYSTLRVIARSEITNKVAASQQALEKSIAQLKALRQTGNKHTGEKPLHLLRRYLTTLSGTAFSEEERKPEVVEKILASHDQQNRDIQAPPKYKSPAPQPQPRETVESDALPVKEAPRIDKALTDAVNSTVSTLKDVNQMLQDLMIALSPEASHAYKTAGLFNKSRPIQPEEHPINEIRLGPDDSKK